MTEIKRYAHGSRVPGWDQAADLTKDPIEIPDPAVTPVPQELRTAIERKMSQYPDHRSAVIFALHEAQELHGWCSPEAIAQVACVMKLTPAYVTAVVTFYDMFKTEPAGNHDIFVCTNISCSLRGADRIYSAIKAAAEGNDEINVKSFECLGACDLAPMASVDGTYVGPLEQDDASKIVQAINDGEPVLPEKQLQRRLAADTVLMQQRENK